MRKGQSVLGYKGLYFIVALFILTFIFLFMRSAFIDYQAGKVECTDTAVNSVLIAQFLYSDCFTYGDTDIGQNLPGTIDKNKFTQENYVSCIYPLNQNVNISIDGKTIGKQIYNPYIINKTIWVYENNEKTFSTIQFTFEEPPC